MRREAEQSAVTVFSSYGTSPDTWRRGGILGREMKYLRLLQERLGPVGLVSYGEADPHVAHAGGISLITGRPRWLHRGLYSVLQPFLHWRAMRRTSVFRTNQLRGAWTAAIAAMIHRKPLVVRTGYVWSQFNRTAGGKGLRHRAVLLLERLALHRAGVVIVASEGDRELLARTHGLMPARIHVVPNPVDTDLFAMTGEKDAATGGPVTFVGRLEPQKGVELLIEAVSQIPGARLQIIGDGSLRRDLEERSAGLPVEFTGVLPNEDLADVLRKSAAFVLPSLYEGTPKALLEAMACGSAVVVARAPGSGAVVEHEKTGLLVERTADSLAAGISRLLSDSGLRQRLGVAASDYVLRQHSMQAAADRETDLIRDLARSSGVRLPFTGPGAGRSTERAENAA